MGSGSERLDGKTEQELASKILQLGAKIVCLFSEISKAVDFKGLREELTARKFAEELLGEAPNETVLKQQKQIISDIVTMVEFQILATPLKSVLGFLAENARNAVLASSIRKCSIPSGLPTLIAATWLADIDSVGGREALVREIKSMPPGVFVRVVLAIHLVYRVYWHKWRHEDRSALIQAAEEAFKSADLRFNRSDIEHNLEEISEEATR